ncbi:FAD-dependent oxidoreductase [Verminephrobacter aporrectodeae subsp. tuberculatae]|uniref:NAD(P)/FAD-dependent oxidoreductase n=1 Tax=Verminephrobacter aporrectodeae TaxID=1110389 RepID=UPI002244410F|nr:FAD-dependent oxidoreductase [Verminephrobacter aporrectodeae]MCW8165178.1 FAD-dependent oxidoreductase [Verminephrobacter aporrectodeae subsp. tuberculatae]MCW8168304.1 FAD-dependent oxidoreductase [Verminephrobacter aporrectodeae subsp. tuberculatae]
MSTTVPRPRQAAAPARSPGKARRHFAVVGAGMAGIVCARTLVQAGHRVTVFEKSAQAGGRTATIDSPFGSFDAGAQYFTVRAPRFAQAMDSTPGVCKRWSANSVQVLDAEGRVAAPGLPQREAHWVASPGMQSLVSAWAEPLLQAGRLITHTRVTRIETDGLNAAGWQLRTEGPGGSPHVHAGFDAVLLAQPAVPAQSLLADSALDSPLSNALGHVATAPCWTLMLAYPQAVRPGLTTLGPQWNAARSTHHRIAWLARESSKPGRNVIERWTVQASPAWSAEHLEDDAVRVQAKLIRAFAEVTGIHAEPAHAATRRWRYAQTTQPLGRSHLWDAARGLGACGDWCLGHRLEDAFLSGLELALAVA